MSHVLTSLSGIWQNPDSVIDMGQKGGGAVPPFRGSWISIQHNVAWAKAYLCTEWHLDLSTPVIWPQQTWPKIGGCAPLGGAGSPSNTMILSREPKSLRSGILMHPAVWPQQTWAKNWGAVPLCEGLGPHLTQCVHGQGRPPYQVQFSSVQFSNFYSGLSDKHHHKDHCSVKCTAR